MIEKIKHLWSELSKFSISCSFKKNPPETKQVNDKPCKTEAEQIVCLLRKLQCKQKKLRMYKEFWDNISNALFLVNMSTEMILDANPVACSMYGYSREEMIQMKFTELSDDPECTRTAGRQKLQRVPLRRHIRKGGHVFPVSASMTYFNDQGYDVCAIIVHEWVERDLINEFI
jgi:PAS domain S-box-containing protein